MTPPLLYRSRRFSRAFTAIEITAVATIIAILALLILPLLRGRVETARLTAAQDDIKQLMKAEMLAYADTDYYFRIQDLDNTQVYDPPPSPAAMVPPVPTPDLAVPHAYWNYEISSFIRERLAERWMGPYVSIPRNERLEDLTTLMPNLFWGAVGDGGPIYITTRDDLENDRYPIDPWGNPYIFFGPGLLYQQAAFPPGTEPATPPAAPLNGTETDFANSVIFCMGPDGYPGDATLYTTAPTPGHYRRESNWLGAKGADDLDIYF
jgi:type II secretory pathway pseudopilin PulG